MLKTGRLIVAAGEHSADMLYATKLATPDEFIYCETPEEDFALVSPLEFSRAESVLPPSVKLYSPDHFGSGRTISAQLLAIADKYRIERFMVPQRFPVFLADFLRNKFIHVEAVEGEFFPQREFKTSAEVESILRAQRAAEASLRRAEEILREAEIGRDGVLNWRGELLTSELMRFELSCVMLKRDIAPGLPIIAGGEQSAQPHCVGHGPLYADRPIVFDIFPRDNVAGYHGDITRTFAKRSAPDVALRAYEAVREARDESRKLYKDGAVASSIFKRAKDVLDCHGFFTGRNERGDYGFFHSLGHGVGLDIHEAPRVSVQDNVLKAGQVITVEPGVYYPEWGGIRLEDMVYVREDGSLLLTEYESTFIVP